MASCGFQTTVNVNCHHRVPPPNYVYMALATTKSKTNDGFYSSSSSSSSCFIVSSVKNRSILIRKRSCLWRCHVDSEPPSNKQNTPPSGVVATLTRFQDTLQIFFAVLFWMSLFFWSCAWYGKDNNGRPNKGSRFRK